jgi:bifunctional DNase/RNase
LGTGVHSTCVLDPRDNMWIAELRFLPEQTDVTLDTHPSDALLLCVRARVPFLFREALWTRYAVPEPLPVCGVLAFGEVNP